MIQITKLKINYKLYFFIKYIAKNGNYICAVNDEIVSKDDGNQMFKNLILESENYKVEKSAINKNNSEIIEYISSGIDKYAHYIDNYKQYREAMDNNERLYKLIEEFEAIC